MQPLHIYKAKTNIHTPRFLVKAQKQNNISPLFNTIKPVIFQLTKTQIIKRLFRKRRRSEPICETKQRKLIIHTSHASRKPSIIYDTEKYQFTPKMYMCPNRVLSNDNIARKRIASTPWDDGRLTKFIDAYQTQILKKNNNLNNYCTETPEKISYELLRVKKIGIEHSAQHKHADSSAHMHNFIGNQKSKPQIIISICNTEVPSQTTENTPSTARNTLVYENTHGVRKKSTSSTQEVNKILTSECPNMLLERGRSCQEFDNKLLLKPNVKLNANTQTPPDSRRSNKNVGNKIDLSYRRDKKKKPQDSIKPPVLIRSQSTKSSQMNEILSRKQIFFEKADLAPWD